MPAGHAGSHHAVATCSISLTTLPLSSLQALGLPESGSCLPARLKECLLQCAASLTGLPLPSMQALGLPEFLKQRNAELVVTADKDGPNSGASLRLSTRLDELHMLLTCPWHLHPILPYSAAQSLGTRPSLPPQSASLRLPPSATCACTSAPVC